MPVLVAPLDEARRQLGDKTPLGSVLNSAEWEQVPVAIRQRAQFSAGVTSARLLQGIQDKLAGILGLADEQLQNGKSANLSRSFFIDAIRDLARSEGLDQLLDPAKLGTLQDITSIPRLALIHDMQVADAQGYAQWRTDQRLGAALLYPAWEFVRVESRKEPRQSWTRRWAESGGRIYSGRMIARKDDPVWTKLSRFGKPWPPFDYGSGMGLEDVERDEAISLGVITEDDEPPTGGEADFNAGLKAEIAGLSPQYRQGLENIFDGRIKIAGDQVTIAA